jgi:ligand-binding sensor domain-containing protein
LKNGNLLASSRVGVSRWDAAGQSWQSLTLPTQRPPLVRALMQDERGWVWAGTELDGVFLSTDDGVTWRAAGEGLANNQVFSLAVDRRGRVVAGTSAGVYRALNLPAN